MTNSTTSNTSTTTANTDFKQDKFVDVVFSGPPGPGCCRFVEVENQDGKSISYGRWLQRCDGYWVLRITDSSAPFISALKEERDAWKEKAETNDQECSWQAKEIEGLTVERDTWRSKAQTFEHECGRLGEELVLAHVASAVPDGWKLAPIEPTEHQAREGLIALIKTQQTTGSDGAKVDSIYRAMVAAAPVPSAASGALSDAEILFQWNRYWKTKKGAVSLQDSVCATVREILAAHAAHSIVDAAMGATAMFVEMEGK